jgi:hypothetical protein
MDAAQVRQIGGGTLADEEQLAKGARLSGVDRGHAILHSGI